MPSCWVDEATALTADANRGNAARRKRESFIVRKRGKITGTGTSDSTVEQGPTEEGRFAWRGGKQNLDAKFYLFYLAEGVRRAAGRVATNGPDEATLYCF